MKQYRNEWKFEYKENDVLELISRLSLVLVQDQHGENENYSVYSMYFDDYNDTSARDTEAGLSIRYKYRIRHYGDISSLHLERKEKMDCVTKKHVHLA